MSDQDALAGLTVSHVEHFAIEARYPRTIGRNAVLSSHGDSAGSRAVAVQASDGSGGWGLVRGAPPASDLVGRRLDELIDTAVGVTDETALWADFALHDLAGVASRTSVHRMLGAAGDRQVPVYDGSIYLDDLDEASVSAGIDRVLANVADGWEHGYRAFKLKIGRGFTWMPEGEGLARDVEVTRAVRDAFPDARILADGNNGFTVDGLIRYLDDVADVGLYWIEEPFHEHRNGLERLRAWLDDNGSSTLVADGEFRPDVEEVVRLARDGLIDVLLMDVMSFGLTPWRRLAGRLEGTSVQISPHAWGLPLKTLYAAQMAAGLGRVPTVEGVRGEADGVDTGSYAFADGVLTVPELPGFGIPAPAALEGD